MHHPVLVQQAKRGIQEQTKCISAILSGRRYRLKIPPAVYSSLVT